MNWQLGVRFEISRANDKTLLRGKPRSKAITTVDILSQVKRGKGARSRQLRNQECSIYYVKGLKEYQIS